MAAQGAGLGNGLTCIVLTWQSGANPTGARIDCSAPGPDSTGLSSSAIIAIAVGASIAGLVLLVLAARWCYHRHKASEADKLRASMGMSTRNGQVYAASKSSGPSTYAAGTHSTHSAGTNTAIVVSVLVAMAWHIPCGACSLPMRATCWDALNCVELDEFRSCLLALTFPFDLLCM